MTCPQVKFKLLNECFLATRVKILLGCIRALLRHTDRVKISKQKLFFRSYVGENKNLKGPTLLPVTFTMR